MKYLPGERVLVKGIGIGTVIVMQGSSVGVRLDKGHTYLARVDAIERVPSMKGVA